MDTLSVGSDQRLEAACGHVERAWLPAQHELLSKLRRQLRSGAYEGRREDFIAVLKKDVALYPFCVRRLALHRKAEGCAQPASPQQLIREQSAGTLAEVFEIDPSALSAHLLSEADELQIPLLKQSIISASVAETLSAQCSIDAELGYSCALFRQLGLMLIAWNYPHVYRRALAGKKSAAQASASLSRILGFSPQLLGFTLARRWLLSAEFRLGMGDSRAVAEASPTALYVGESLDRICRIGEALARAADPQHYPEARQDWEFACAQIEQLAGPSGMQLVREKLENNCEFYRRSIPDCFECPAELIKQSKPARVCTAGQQLLAENEYVNSCPATVRDKLRLLYNNIDGVNIARDNIEMLSREILPLCGFSAGCVYLLEPAALTLVPRLAVGSVKIGRFQVLNCHPDLSADNPVLRAFYRAHPLMEDQIQMHGRLVSCVAGVLGSFQKAGVLYLEVSVDTLRKCGGNIEDVFKALRQALSHCLGLR